MMTQAQPVSRKQMNADLIKDMQAEGHAEEEIRSALSKVNHRLSQSDLDFVNRSINNWLAFQ